MPANAKTLQLTEQQGLGLSAANKVKMGIEFVEVLSQNEQVETDKAVYESSVKNLEQKINKSDNAEANGAI